ncbi:hypothetical protein SZ25_00293, partial [Candidatus Arcanobacter lacustris]
MPKKNNENNKDLMSELQEKISSRNDTTKASLNIADQIESNQKQRKAEILKNGDGLLVALSKSKAFQQLQQIERVNEEVSSSSDVMPQNVVIDKGTQEASANNFFVDENKAINKLVLKITNEPKIEVADLLKTYAPPANQGKRDHNYTMLHALCNYKGRVSYAHFSQIMTQTVSAMQENSFKCNYDVFDIKQFINNDHSSNGVGPMEILCKNLCGGGSLSNFSIDQKVELIRMLAQKGFSLTETFHGKSPLHTIQ